MDHNWWGMSTMSSQPQYLSSLFAASPSQLPPYPQNFLNSCHENHDLPSTDSWSQLLLSGFVEEKGKNDCDNLQVKKLDDYGKTGLYPSVDFHVSDARQENTGNLYADSEESQATRSPWSQFLPASSPTSCVTSFRSNILDFSSNREGHQQQSDQSSECNSYDTGAPLKKARIQPSPSAVTVRKEKLGDRITALHQLVSPYGKTDTASVLLEAIGYIRFLQSQIEALSLPFLGGGLSNTKTISLLNDSSKRRGVSQKEIEEEKPKKDLRSRGLCLVPISFTLQAGSNSHCANHWTSSAIARRF